MKRSGILRIIDANLNRCLEGLRVLEDASRFMLNDRVITKKLKEARHKVKTAAVSLPVEWSELLKARNSTGDVGAGHSVKDEFNRSGVSDIIKANFKRVEESLRVLEEFTKLVSPASGETFKKIRFGIYTVEKKMFSARFIDRLKKVS